MINKSLNEQLLVQIINLTKSLSQKPKRPLIYPFHHTTLNNHIHQLMFIPLGNIHLQQLMCTLLKV